MVRRRIITAYEQDVHTSWRRWYTHYQRAGMAREVKTSTNQRERRDARRSIQAGRYDEL